MRDILNISKSKIKVILQSNFTMLSFKKLLMLNEKNYFSLWRGMSLITNRLQALFKRVYASSICLGYASSICLGYAMNK